MDLLRRDRPKRWRLRPEPAQVPKGPFPPLVGRILAHRGVCTAAGARAFLEGESSGPRDAYRLPGMVEAVACLSQAVQGGECVAVFGDFDVDGVTATALMAGGLERLGARVFPYLPHRVSEGYGLNQPAIAALRERGAEVLLAVDCGTSAVGEVRFARERGMEVVIVDHHQAGDEVPPASALVNPKVSAGGGLGTADLTSAGLASHLLAALHDALGRPFEAQEHLDLVALGTVCDMAPLLGENRGLVRRGLVALAQTERLGLSALMEAAGIDRAGVDCEALSFVLGPRLNAAGRLAHAELAYRLLTCDSAAEGRSLAQQLDDLNAQRQHLTREALERAERLLDEEPEAAEAPLVMLGHREFSPGIVGLVAARLTEVLGRPAVVYQRGEGRIRASARSIPEFDIGRALRSCSDLLVRFGGHSQAAGFTAESARLGAIRQRLVDLAGEALAGVELSPCLDIDAEVPLRALRGEEVRWLGRLAPHGVGNPEPLFLSRGVAVVEARPVGGEGRHLRLRLRDGPVVWPAIAFNLGEAVPSEGQALDVVFSVSPDRRTAEALQLQVKDLAPTGRA